MNGQFKCGSLFGVQDKVNWRLPLIFISTHHQQQQAIDICVDEVLYSQTYRWWEGSSTHNITIGFLSLLCIRYLSEMKCTLPPQPESLIICMYLNNNTFLILVSWPMVGILYMCRRIVLLMPIFGWVGNHHTALMWFLAEFRFKHRKIALVVLSSVNAEGSVAFHDNCCEYVAFEDRGRVESINFLFSNKHSHRRHGSD